MQLTYRRYGLVNWLGFYTLYSREVRRFMKVATQTVLAPLVTTLLFLAVFVLALGHAMDRVGDSSYVAFLAPGLIMMAMTQNAFANTSSSLLIAKVQGNIVDLLMPPLTPIEMTAGIALGGVTRGLLVGFVTALAILFFAPLGAAHPFYILYHAVMASLMMALLGILAGIWSEKFDHLAAITNFVVTPLAFLSGAFYSIHRLPDVWQAAAHANPLFYMIDGFRYGFIGSADGSVHAGLWMLFCADIGLFGLVYYAIRRGYRLKA